MSQANRLVPLVAAGLAASMLAACANYPMSQPGPSYPSATYPATSSYPAGNAPVAMEYGRVMNIEYLQGGTTAGRGGPNVAGAVIGGVAGAVLGRQIGSGTGRDVGTVLGGVGGAAVGSQIGRGQAPATTTAPSYRITVQTDQGVRRVYEVATPGDLRVGDRVRVENGVIYRS